MSDIAQAAEQAIATFLDAVGDGDKPTGRFVLIVEATSTNDESFLYIALGRDEQALMDESTGAWMTINSNTVLNALNRVANGETPDDVMLSLYLDSEQDTD